MNNWVNLAMTVYNRQEYLPMSIESVINQTYPYWRLSIVDDGSTDLSPQIIREYARKYRRIIYSIDRHCGRAIALKKALDLENSSKYISWLDSDDWLACTAIELTVDILDKYNDFGVVYSNYFDVDKFGKIVSLGDRTRIPYCSEKLLVSFMTFHLRTIRRTLYDRVGGIDLNFPQAQDYDLCLKLSEVTNFYYLNQPLYYYRNHELSISSCTKEKQRNKSAEAVRNALVRRGLSHLVYLDDRENFKLLSLK